MGREGIAFHVVTGFLGAGKTTLINRLLRAPELADALVIVNEWGDIGLDHLLYERLSSDAILINGRARPQAAHRFAEPRRVDREPARSPRRRPARIEA
jgi:hypothetical protein